MAKEFLRDDLGEGFFLYYREVMNMLDGCYPVNMMLYRIDENGEEVFVKEITDRDGKFLDFPGFVHGRWEDYAVYALEPHVRFLARVGEYKDGVACFRWMFQPDGFYYMDDDGFGADDDEEIWLYALMDENGDFITPFSDYVPDRPS